MNRLYYFNFINIFGNILFSMLKLEWLQSPVLLWEYHNSRQNILILFWKYLVNNRSEAWLNLFWENINGKLFAVLLM